jgi:predicted ABC-type transport system involved in lysophospholipase L1 biosynthesis ATPase subunit
MVVDLLMTFLRDIDATAVVVTHDARVAARFDEVVALRDGRVVAEAPAPVAVATDA